MGKLFLQTKFTSLAVLALFLADSSAVLLQKEAKKDCGDVGCDRHLSYDFNQPDLDKAEAHNVAANHHFAGATKAAAAAADAMAAATAHAADTAAADAASGAAKAGAAATFAGTSYKDPGFPAAEAANAAAVKAKEVALDNALKAEDDKVAKTLISARKDRDLAASTAAKAASDANLKANQERFAYEKDQLERGENQDRLKFVNQATAAKTSVIQGKHDERERANGRLLKALASF